MASPSAQKADRILTMPEVKERLRFRGQGGLYRLIHDDPDFVTFKVRDAKGSPRLMREAAFDQWVRKQEQKAKAA